MNITEGRAAELIAEHAGAVTRNGRMGKVARYLSGDQDLPYMPRAARREFRELAEKSITPWLPLISDTFSKGLFVDGYRPAKSVDNAEPWDYWQRNGLDARQTVIHRGTLEYGAAYNLVLPARGPAPLIRPLPPLKCWVRFEDDDDEWAYDGLILKGRSREGDRLYQLLEGNNIHALRVPKDSDKPVLISTDTHPLGVVPLVRFRDRLDAEARGIIEPLIVLQDRVNEAVFNLLIALQYASFRQRWASGLDIPVDPDTGKPVEPFESAVNRLWVTDNPDAKFGDFAQTDVSGHLRTYESAVKTMAAIAQVPPQALMGDLVQLSAEALAAAEASTQRKTQEYETLFGESWEQSLRLGARAQGNREAAQDTSAQVRWRDTEARTLSATVDALGKMAQMLMVPVEGLWERIPGVTDQDVEAWKELTRSGDSMRALAEALTGSVGDANAAQAQTTVAPPAPQPGPEPGE